MFKRIAFVLIVSPLLVGISIVDLGVIGSIPSCSTTKSPMEDPETFNDGNSVVEYYREAEKEFNAGNIDNELWTRALVEAEGDETKRKAKYIELRAKQLSLESGTAIASLRSNDQVGLDNNASISDVSGRYQSEITTNSHWHFLKKYKNLEITITQSGTKIRAIDLKYQTKIEGTLDGGVITFRVEPNVVSGFYDAEGEWVLRADKTGFEGRWRSRGGSDAGSGIWNLYKIN